MIRREPCVCGGVIVVSARASWEQIANAIRHHNKTALHRVWRWENQLPGMAA